MIEVLPLSRTEPVSESEDESGDESEEESSSESGKDDDDKDDDKDDDSSTIVRDPTVELEHLFLPIPLLNLSNHLNNLQIQIHQLNVSANQDLHLSIRQNISLLNTKQQRSPNLTLLSRPTQPCGANPPAISNLKAMRKRSIIPYMARNGPLQSRKSITP